MIRYFDLESIDCTPSSHDSIILRLHFDLDGIRLARGCEGYHGRDCLQLAPASYKAEQKLKHSRVPVPVIRPLGIRFIDFCKLDAQALCLPEASLLSCQSGTSMQIH